MSEPVADSVRAILDGHIVLARNVANRGHYPAIDILSSVSRLMTDLASEDELAVVKRAIRALSVYQSSKDLIDVGAYRAGANPELDAAIRIMPELEMFLAQQPRDTVTRADAIRQLAAVLSKRQVN